MVNIAFLSVTLLRQKKLRARWFIPSVPKWLSAYTHCFFLHQDDKDLQEPGAQLLTHGEFVQAADMTTTMFVILNASKQSELREANHIPTLASSFEDKAMGRR